MEATRPHLVGSVVTEVRAALEDRLRVATAAAGETVEPAVDPMVKAERAARAEPVRLEWPGPEAQEAAAGMASGLGIQAEMAGTAEVVAMEAAEVVDQEVMAESVFLLGMEPRAASEPKAPLARREPPDSAARQGEPVESLAKPGTSPTVPTPQTVVTAQAARDLDLANSTYVFLLGSVLISTNADYRAHHPASPGRTASQNAAISSASFTPPGECSTPLDTSAGWWP